MPNTTSVDVTPRVCADAPAAATSEPAAAAIATARAIVDLFIFSSLIPRACDYSGLARLGIHAVDHPDVLFIHEFALELHRRRELVVLGGELLLDQAELLDRLDAREVLVHPLDLRPNQVVDPARPAQRDEV